MIMNKNDTQRAIESGKTVLGIEFGSTRIKAVLIGEDHAPIASGGYDWENRYENGIWSYSLEDVWTGLQESYRQLSKEVSANYSTSLQNIGAIGFSGMMHGYMAFDKDGNLLVPFRTWRNTTTAQAAEDLTELFQFNVPHRWSVAHLYQAILNKEHHIKDISYQTTLSGYVHWKLTGQKVLGIGDASGMFPIDSQTNDYDASKVKLFNERLEADNIAWKPKFSRPEMSLGYLPNKVPSCSTLPDNCTRQFHSVRPRATQAQAWWRPTAWRSERATFRQERPFLP
jgi:sugar (pentulose or hexulose) kinase